MLKRRQFLGAGAGLCAYAACSFVPVWAQSAPNLGTPTLPSPGFRRTKMGDVEIISVLDGIARRPLGEEFVKNAPLAEVKALLTSQGLPTDYIDVPFTPFVVIAGGRKVLIDTGLGEFGGPNAGKLLENLRAAGVPASDIDTVLISHFHGDHINGLRNKAGELAFAKAKVMVPAAEYAFWMDDAKMAAAPAGQKGAFENARRTFSANKERLVEGRHFFKKSADEIRTRFPGLIAERATEDVTLLTERGYLVLVKSFTDDLAWQVQEQLVDGYFRAKDATEAILPPQHRVRMPQPQPVRDLLLIGKAMAKIKGVNPSLAMSFTLDAIERTTGLPASMIAKALPAVAPNDLAELNATQVGDHFGMSARAINPVLEKMGLQFKDEMKHWKLTEAGTAFGEMKPFHKGGHSGYEIRWKQDVIEVIKRHLDGLGLAA